MAAGALAISGNEKLTATTLRINWRSAEWVGLWCREGESNPQGTKYRRILSPLRVSANY